MTNTYFVYIHRTSDCNQPFYVGKGTRRDSSDEYRRAFDSHRRKRMWKGVAGRHGFIVEIHAEFFAENDALRHEAELIAEFGRRETGAGTLVNHTDGGVGCSGYKHKPESVERIRSALTGKRLTAERRAKISVAISGIRHPGWGKKQLAITSERKRASMQGVQLGGNSPLAKKVVDTKSGRIFPSTRDAAEYLGMPMSTMATKLRGDRTNNTSLEFA